LVVNEHQRIILFNAALALDGIRAGAAFLGEDLPSKVKIALPNGDRWVEIPEDFRGQEYPIPLEYTVNLFLKFV
jgi:hypothetical protein